MANKSQVNLTMSDEHVAFEKANRSMSTGDMAKVLGIKVTTLYNNRAIILKRELAPCNDKFFNIELYTDELKTI